MNPVTYYSNPVWVLYWVTLKKNIPLKEWAEMMRKHYGPRLGPPLLDAVLLIEKYCT